MLDCRHGTRVFGGVFPGGAGQSHPGVFGVVEKRIDGKGNVSDNPFYKKIFLTNTKERVI
jgi:hypothetical protein